MSEGQGFGEYISIDGLIADVAERDAEILRLRAELAKKEETILAQRQINAEQRAQIDYETDLRAQVAALRKALTSIRDVGLGPDRGSGQWQADCAMSIASTALKETDDGH
jgi:multidrug efflux pump subunit AcrA (membrane-fusion protein)